MIQELERKKLRYFELRPLYKGAIIPGHVQTAKYCLHSLRTWLPGLRRFFQDSIKTPPNVRFAGPSARAFLIEEGTSQALLELFPAPLRLMTQRRHLTPPQPRRWFHHLIQCFGNQLKIRVAFKEKEAIAAILTLQYKQSMVYKYGCSDARFHRLGGMRISVLAFHPGSETGKRIEEVFDFGRSDWDNPGLITFKDRWGAERREINYLRVATSGDSLSSYPAPTRTWTGRMGKRVIPCLPDAIFERLVPRSTGTSDETIMPSSWTLYFMREVDHSAS